METAGEKAKESGGMSWAHAELPELQGQTHPNSPFFHVYKPIVPSFLSPAGSVLWLRAAGSIFMDLADTVWYLWDLGGHGSSVLSLV